MPASVLRDLPTGGNVFSILETTQPEVIADRFNSGGLNAGQSGRAGGFLGSWSQTQYRIGDVSIVSPNGGAPLLFPELAFWQHIDITSGLMPVDVNASGLDVSLEPRRPAARWTGAVEGSLSGGGLTSTPVSTGVPAIARLEDWAHLSALVSGPLIERRLGLVIGGTWMRNSKFERAAVIPRREEVASVFAHAIMATAPDTEVRTIGWLQQADAADPPRVQLLQTPVIPRNRSAHIQSTIERSTRGARPWRIFGAYTERRRTGVSLLADSLIVERLVDGPIPMLIADGDATERRWSIGARATLWSSGRGRHTLRVGADGEGTRVNARSPFAGVLRELVDGIPARVWVYTAAGRESIRGVTTFSAFARQQITLSPRLTLDAALRFESVEGRAAGATTGIGWRSWLPNASLQWQLRTPLHLTLVTGYRGSANQINLGLLAVGDPAAPVARVFRWDDPIGPLVARVGPGTGGDATFGGIDPALERPRTDEFVIGIESRPTPRFRLGVMGIARRQTQLANVVNTTVGIDSYTMFTVPDANVDLIGAADDQQLPVYNRLPESFARDRYLLTNPGHEPATMGAVVVTARATTDRMFLYLAATASAALASGGNRGFRAFENDQDTIGELFTNPNALTYARGRLFSDRAYTIKWTTVYRFPWDVRLGAIARYQDGQPFARLVIVPGLNQGVEAVQAFANGRSRFAFTGTLDVRLQKGLAAGVAQVEAILDVYNVLGMNKEVEEYVVTGDRFRTPTAVQPPRTFHVGVRLGF
jgi:TonB dependent receptor